MSKQKTASPAPGAGPRRKTSWRLNVLVLFIFVFLTLAVGEAALRLLWHNSYAGDSAEHVVHLRVHQANRDYEIDRSQVDDEQPTVRLRTGARSYVLPSFQHEQPSATIAFLGGSTTECAAVREELRFPARVSQLLDERGWKVNTLNAARSGSTLHDSINIVFNHVAADRPDIIVVMNAANDVGCLAGDGDYRSRSGKPLSLSTVGLWTKNTLTKHVYLAALARKCFSRGPQPGALHNRKRRTDPAVAKTLNVDAFRQRLHIFIHLCRDLGIRPVLMTQPFSGSSNELTPDWADLGSQDLFNEVIREAGSQEGVLVIDLVRHLKEDVSDWDQPMVVFYDGIHVGDDGSETYAQYITEKLLPLVEEVAAKKMEASLP